MTNGETASSLLGLNTLRVIKI